MPSKEEQALCRPWLEQEIDLVDPRLVIPIGRLAIGLFFDGALSLDRIVGTQIERDERVIIPLPPPSGASTWHNRAANQARLKEAIRLIRMQREALGL